MSNDNLAKVVVALKKSCFRDARGRPLARPYFGVESMLPTNKQKERRK